MAPPDHKARRYDRQLRLWATSGQQSLESCRILCIGSDACASQTLKNLVLPGIHTYTLLSSKTVDESDIGSDFFLLPESLGANWAEEVVTHLSGLNENVQGVADTRSLSDVIKNDPGFFSEFTLIITCNLAPAEEHSLATHLWESSAADMTMDTPLLSIRTSGFAALLRTQYRERCITNTHPAHTHGLRLNRPFKALMDYAESIDLAGLDSMEHSHVPYPAILVRALLKFKRGNNDKNPTYDQLDDFKTTEIGSLKRSADEENFQEAEEKAWAVLEDATGGGVVQPGEGVSKVLELDGGEWAQKVTKESKPFWILFLALKRYLDAQVHQPPLLPLSSTLPDMHTSTASYIHLQNIYKAQSLHEQAAFKESLNRVLRDELQCKSDQEALEVVGEDDREEFVRNVVGVVVERGRPLSEWFDPAAYGQEFETEVYTASLTSTLALAFYLAERHHVEHASWPGTVPDEYYRHKANMFEGAKELMGWSTLGNNVDRDEDGKLYVAPLDEEEDESEETVEGMDDGEKEIKEERRTETIKAKMVQDSIDEVVRGGMCVLPTTAALVGGLAGQEAIKLITNQYIPLNGTCVIDLVKGGMARYA